jgi:hypothetical protein
MVGILKRKVKGSVRKEPIKYRWLAPLTEDTVGSLSSKEAQVGIEGKALPGPEFTPLAELPGGKLDFPRRRES